jgi:hypothetical protein
VAELLLLLVLSKGASPVGGTSWFAKKFQEFCMKWNNVSLLLLLALLISACDSQQPTYSASNANSAPPPAPPAAPPPPPPAAEPAAPTPVAETRPAPPPAPVSVARHTPSASLPERSEALAPIQPIGIGSCDSYIERYRTCVNNGVASGTMPNSSKFALMHTFNRQVRKWQADVAAGNTTELVSACAEADKQARDELVKAGCRSF